MKSLVTAIVFGALSFPLAALAQTDSGLTRAQVKDDLRQLEQVGYDPFKAEDPNYPADIQAAEARLAERNGATGYGGMPAGSTASGAPVVIRPASPGELREIYSGGQ
jgi:hypothetical protein